MLTHPSSRLTVIDPFQPFHLTRWKHGFPGKPGYPPPTSVHFEERFDRNMRETGAGERLVKLKGTSRDLLRTLPLDSFDFVFIDGSHAPVDVLRDATEGWELLKTDGLLVFDDYLMHSFTEPYHSPRFAVDAFMAIYLDRYEPLSTGWQMWLKKKTPAPRAAAFVPLDTTGPQTKEDARNAWAGEAQGFLTRLWRGAR